MRRPGTHAALAGLVAAGLAVWAGCNGIVGIHEGVLVGDGSVGGDVVTPESGADSPHDGTTGDGTTGSDASDASDGGGGGESSVTDAPQDVKPDVPTVYND